MVSASDAAAPNVRVFGYVPNEPGAAISLVAFLLIGIWTARIAWKTRSRPGWFMAVTALLEAGGYAGKASSHLKLVWFEDQSDVDW